MIANAAHTLKFFATQPKPRHECSSTPHPKLVQLLGAASTLST
jgi:hypothetical protein